MLITLTGNNSFLLKAELKKLVDLFVEEYSNLGLDRLDGEEVEYDQIRESLESLPFLASKKMVVLRVPSANKKFIEKFEQLLDALPVTTDLIIHEPKLDKRSSYYKYLKKNTEFSEFNELDNYGLSKWLNENVEISIQDAKYLLERVGPNQQLLSNEIDKLTTYNPKVTRESIDLLTEPNPRSTIFELLDSAFAGDTKRMMKLYDDQRANKVESQQIVAMLAWQLHILAIIKTAGEKTSAQIASEAKVNPFVIGKSRDIARKITLIKLKKLINDLSELDLKSKTSTIDVDEAIQNYLLKI